MLHTLVALHGKGPPAKKSLFRGEATAKEERALLEDASHALAAKGSSRGKGYVWRTGKGGGRGRGDAFEPPPAPSRYVWRTGKGDGHGRGDALEPPPSPSRS